MRDLNSKIKPMAELLPIIENLKARGKKVVLGHGVFDLMHYGHMHYLRQAKQLGDVLVVSIITDPFIKKGPDRPVFQYKIRAHSVAFLECVDYIVPCEEEGPYEIIKRLKPDIYAKGEDAISQLKDPRSGLSKDKRLIESVGGIIHFTKSLPIHSTELLRNFFGSFSAEANTFLSGFKKSYPAAEVIKKIGLLRKLKVLVIGEAIIDEYRYVTPLGKPSKSNIISTSFVNKEEFAGGALACANHVAAVCGQVDLVTYLGSKNSKEQFIRKHLKPNINPKFFFVSNQPTIVKRRFVDPAYYSKFFEEYVFDGNYLNHNLEQKIGSYLDSNLSKYDLVIVIDYGHGFLSNGMIKLITKKAKFVAVNAQTNSGNAGFNYINKYSRIDYACLDEIEARLAAQDNFSSIEDIASHLSHQLKIKKMIITRGHLGSLSIQNGKKSSGGNHLFSVPALAYKITDPIGAGDAFLAISAPCAAAGFPIELISFLGNVAGSIAVGILGNKYSVEKNDLFKHINYMLE